MERFELHSSLCLSQLWLGSGFVRSERPDYRSDRFEQPTSALCGGPGI